MIFLLISGYLDVLDGSLSRLQKSSSSFGTILDILSDRFVESFIIIIAIFINQPQIAWVGLLMMMSIIVCISSFLLVGIFSQKESIKSFYYSPGLIERAEIFIFFIIMIFPSIVLMLGLIYTLLVLWTTLYRCYEFYVYDKERSKFR